MKNIVKKALFTKTTKNERTLRILLPDNYDQSNQAYPVLYMHDGQNLFEDDTSYTLHSWGIYETLQSLIKKDLINEIIVVGIDNSNLRFYEYSPWKNSDAVKNLMTSEVGGLGDAYAEFIVNQVKPFIDQNFRTKKEYETTMIAGSSMGAYISCYIAVKYPHVFKHVGVFSLASWFNEDAFLDYLYENPIDQNQRYFISIGRNESSDEKTTDFNEIYLQNSRNLVSLLKNKKVTDILYIETDDKHNELAWRKIFVDFIRFANKKST